MIHLLCVAACMHAFHATVIEVQVVQSMRLNITMHLFADDLEAAVNAVDSSGLDIFGSGQSKEAKDSLICHYVSHTTKLWQDDKSVSLSCLGHEISGNSCKFYLESDALMKHDEVTVRSSNMLALFSDQKNIIHWRTSRGVRSDVLHAGKIESVAFEIDLSE